MSEQEGLDGALIPSLVKTLRDTIGDRCIVATERALDLGTPAAPVPPVALLRRRFDHYSKSAPTAEDVLLLIELAEIDDLDARLCVYAGAGIRETWVVERSGTALRICRAPGDGAYGDCQPAASIRTLGLPGLGGISVDLSQVFAAASQPGAD